MPCRVCGQIVKITGSLCEDCFAQTQEAAKSHRNGLNLRERVKYNLWQCEDSRSGGIWSKRGRRVKK